MAKIIENDYGRRMIKMSADDILSIVREYQRVIGLPKSYQNTRFLLEQTQMYLPEDI